MPRRYRSRDDEYDSDDSFSPEDDIFDVDEEVSDAETDNTEINLLDKVDCDVDAEDLPDLLDNTAHPPEYYRRIAEEVNKATLTSKITVPVQRDFSMP